MISVKKTVLSLMMATFLVAGVSLQAQKQQTAMPSMGQQSQKEYNEKEIDLFAGTVAEVMPIQQEAQKKMIKKIEEGGMQLNNFNQIARQVQQGGEPEGVSEEQMEKFQAISKEIQTINMGIQKKMTKVITDAGMTPAKYQEMIGAYSSNPKMKQKVDQKLAAMQQ